MINKEIDLDNIIRVNIAETPTALTADNLNTIAIFTNEKSQYPIDNYVIYKSINGVADMWGIDSKVYKMIYSIYNQSLNITAGQGYVVVFQLKDNVEIPATSGSILTQNIIYSKFLTVKDGAIGINVDGTIYNLKDIDFSACQDLDMIVNYLNNLFNTNNIPATVYNVDQEIKIISNTSGASSKVEFTAPTVKSTDLTKTEYLNIANSTIIDGTDAQEATPTTLLTTTITPTYWTIVDNGGFTISIDGATATEITNLNFSTVTTVQDIVSILQGAIPNLTIEAVDNTIKFTTNTVGANTNIEITAPTTEGVEDITTIDCLNIAQATKTQGTDAIQATSGYLETTSINIDNFKSVKNGSFKISVDGAEAISILDLDFTTITTLQDIVNILSNSIDIVNISVENTNIRFTSKTSGINSKVAITGEEVVLPYTDLNGVDYFNTSKCILVNGTDAYTGTEKLSDAIIRCKDLIFFEGILTTYIPSDAEILETAQTIQTMNKMYFVVKTSLLNLDVFTTIKDKKFTKTRCLYYGMPDYLLFTSGYASKLLSVDFNGNNTANNVNNKEIIGLAPDTSIGDTELFVLKEMGVDCYCSMRSLGVIQCSGSNDWSDTVLFKNWLVNNLQITAFNVLRTVSTKIPQTEAGVQVLVDNYKQVLTQAVLLGYVSAGTWKGQVAFGDDEELYRNNIEQNGYYIWTLPIKQQSLEQRAQRIAPPCYIALKLAGAINEADIILYVEQ